jgi:hypothetical protein
MRDSKFIDVRRNNKILHYAEPPFRMIMCAACIKSAFRNPKSALLSYLSAMRNKLLLLSLVTLLTGLLHAGDTSNVKTFKRFYIGVSVSGNATYRYLSRVPHTGWDTLYDWRNKHEDPLVGYQIGARIGINATRFMSIETGVDYMLHRYRQKYDPFYLSNSHIKTIYKYHYLNIPLALNFSMGKHKVKGLISMGASFNYLTEKKSRYQTIIGNAVQQDYTLDDRSDFNQFNVSPFLGVGVEWHITKFLFLRLMPMAQMQALKNIDQPITERLWSVGLNAAVYFAFKKVK